MAAALPAPALCTLAAHASVRLAAEEILARRKDPGPACGSPIPFSLLKNADEQTVAGLAACLRAIADFRLAPEGTPAVFRSWGIVASARCLARDFISRAIVDHAAEGPCAVAPHTIPHRTLHSPSGSLSLALGIGGPNHGAGGGTDYEAEGLLCALALLREQRLPGVWLLLSRIDPVVDVDPARGVIPAGTFAEATALALVPAHSPYPGATLKLQFDPAASGPAFALDAALLEKGGERLLPGFGRLSLHPRAVLRAAA